MDIFTQQFAFQVQYLNILFCIIAMIAGHIYLRRNPGHTVELIPVLIYFYELLMFYVFRFIFSYYGIYSTEVFTTVSSLIRLQFGASMSVVLIYLTFIMGRGRKCND